MAEKFLNYSGLTYLVTKIKALIPDISSVDVESASAIQLSDTYELKGNKTTTISSSSTDLEYPSARAVYNAIPSSINGLTSGTAYGGNITIKNQSNTACPTISAAGSNNNNSVELSNTTLSHKVNGSTYNLTLPNKNGTLAVTSEIPDVSTKLDNPGAGTAGQVLTYTSSGAAWATPTSGTVNSVTLNGTTYLPDGAGDVDLGAISGGSSKLIIDTTTLTNNAEYDDHYWNTWMVPIPMHNSNNKYFIYELTNARPSARIIIDDTTDVSADDIGNQFYVLIRNTSTNYEELDEWISIATNDAIAYPDFDSQITMVDATNYKTFSIELGFIITNAGEYSVEYVMTRSEMLVN